MGLSTEVLWYEGMSAFDHGLWERYHLLGLYEYSPQILEAHNRQTRMYAYSPTQDAFYALSNGEPNMSPAGCLWQAVVNSKNFDLALAMFKKGDLNVKANLVYWLSLVYENFIVPESPSQKPQPQQQPQLGDEENEGEAGGEGEDEENEDQPDDQPGDQSGQEDGNQPDDQPGKPAKFNLSADDMADILTNGQGQSQEPGDTQANPDANVGNGFKLKMPPGFKMPGLGEVESQNETDEVLESLIGTEEGTPTEKRHRMEEFHQLHAIKNLAKFLGFAEHVTRAAERQHQAAVGIHKGIKRGRWDGRVLVQEKRKVMTKDPQALMRFADRKLRKFATATNIPVGNGDVYVLRDQSSSMRDNRPYSFAQYDADPRKMSKATLEKWQAFLAAPDKDTQAVNLEIALAYHFRASGRDFTSIPWEAKKSRVYKYGSPGLEDHLNEFYNGGTRINHVLEKTLGLIERPEAKSDYADILILTDAAIDDRPDHDKILWKRIGEFRKKGGRIWAVLIGCEDLYAEQMHQWVDGAVTVKSLMSGEFGLEEIVKNMAIQRAESDRVQV